MLRNKNIFIFFQMIFFVLLFGVVNLSLANEKKILLELNITAPSTDASGTYNKDVHSGVKLTTSGWTCFNGARAGAFVLQMLNIQKMHDEISKKVSNLEKTIENIKSIIDEDNAKTLQQGKLSDTAKNKITNLARTALNDVNMNLVVNATGGSLHHVRNMEELKTRYIDRIREHFQRISSEKGLVLDLNYVDQVLIGTKYASITVDAAEHSGDLLIDGNSAVLTDCYTLQDVYTFSNIQKSTYQSILETYSKYERLRGELQKYLL